MMSVAANRPKFSAAFFQLFNVLNLSFYFSVPNYILLAIMMTMIENKLTIHCVNQPYATDLFSLSINCMDYIGAIGTVDVPRSMIVPPHC